LVIGSLAALFASVALKLLEPWPLKWVFDHILKTRNVANRRFLDDFLATLDPVSILALAAGSVIVITALRALAEYGNTVGFALVGNRVLTEVRNDLYRQLQRLSLSFHTKARGGDLTVRVVGDVNMLKDVAATAMLPLAANVLILIGMAGLMLWLEWRLALLALLTLPLYWLTTTQLTRRIREASRKQRAREGEMASAAAESLAAVKDLQALSLEPVFAEQFIDRSRKCQTQNVVTARLSASLERRVDVLGALATALVLFFGVKLALNDSMSAGDLLIFLAYLKRAYNPLQDFAKYTGRLAKAAAAGERVLDVLGRTPDVRDLPDAVPAGMLRGDVCFESVSFSYETGRTVLNGIDFAMPAGSQVALVGPSGIGKSTVVNLLMRLYDPLKGRVLIDGADIRSFTLASLRSQISVVLQDGLLFAASVRDNIAYTTRDVTQAEIETVARLANAHEFIERMPQGYDTVLGERGVTLSHGQRQRIAIARAAIRNAPILILDEPTTGLDEENERTVVAALRRLAQSRTTLIVTHDLRLAARSDLILYIDQGRVVERGTHAELIKADGRYAALYHLQMANDEPTRAEVNHALAR
jgi:ATP-binding cassette subfamily B protein